MYRVLDLNPQLKPFLGDIHLRMSNYHGTKGRLLWNQKSLKDFANAHEYFGIHHVDGGWVYREWAPGAEKMYFTGDFNSWNIYALPMNSLKNGVFEVYLEGEDALKVGQRVQAVIIHNGIEGMYTWNELNVSFHPG